MADLLPEGDFEDEDEGLSKLGLWITVVVIVLILGIGAVGYYLFQMLRAEQAGLGGEVGKEVRRLMDLTHQVTSLQKEVTTLHSQVTLLESKQTARERKWRQMLDQQAKVFDGKLAALEKKLEMSHSKLANQIQFIQRQVNRTRADVMLADAEYLLTVANQKLNLTGDVASALDALAAADALLRQSGDPSVYKVREALARELAALKKVQAPDPVGVSARILALEDRIHTLPLFLPHMGKVSKTESPKEQTSEDLVDQWKNILTIRRRHTERPVEAILTPEEVEAIRHALVLKLETARFAAVRGQPELYRSSLEAAVKWVGRHFQTKEGKVREFIDELNDLIRQPVAVEFPEIGASLKLLRHLPQLRLELDRLDGGAAVSSRKRAAPLGSKPAEKRPASSAPVKADSRSGGEKEKTGRGGAATSAESSKLQ